jgi:REP element-mobilizing transposase RayT
MSKTANLPNELFFVTMTVVNWIDIFTRTIYFDFIADNLKYCQRKKGLEIYEYVVMTNHIHMICLGNKVPLSDILRDFKTFTSKELVKLIRDNPKESRKEWMLEAFKKAGSNNPLNKHFQVWQNLNSPTLLDSNYLIDQKAAYIHNNPVVAGFVSEPHEYYYSSANENGPIVTFDS